VYLGDVESKYFLSSVWIKLAKQLSTVPGTCLSDIVGGAGRGAAFQDDTALTCRFGAATIGRTTVIKI